MIELENISCGYTEANILRGLSLRLIPEDFAVLLGPNGAGKSTLLYAILGFLSLRGGSIHIKGKDLRDYRRADLAKLIAYVPQECNFQFEYLVEEIVLMGRYPWLQLLQSWTDEDREKVRRILLALDLEKFSQRYYSSLSGGEKQRVLIARALAQETDYIFLDETLSQLDINHQIEIMQMLNDIHASAQKGILLISHNLNLAADYAQRLIFLKEGQICGNGSPEEMMNTESLKELFGISLPIVQNPLSGRKNVLYPGRV